MFAFTLQVIIKATYANWLKEISLKRRSERLTKMTVTFSLSLGVKILGVNIYPKKGVISAASTSHQIWSEHLTSVFTVRKVARQYKKISLLKYSPPWATNFSCSSSLHHSHSPSSSLPGLPSPINVQCLFNKRKRFVCYMWMCAIVKHVKTWVLYLHESEVHKPIISRANKLTTQSRLVL